MRRKDHTSRCRGRRSVIEPLENRRLLTVAAIVENVTATEAKSAVLRAAAFTDTESVPTSNFSGVSINWGDGTVSRPGVTVSQPGGPGTPFVIDDTHTYAEEGVYQISVGFHDTADNVNRILSQTTVTVADAALSPGLGPPLQRTIFVGVGGTNTIGDTHTAFSAFESAIGGTLNTAPQPQPNGFRRITWDGVKLDGTDFGGDSTVIVSGKEVAIPVNRFQPSGAVFDQPLAVSGDGFKFVNPSINSSPTALLPAFSPANIVAPMNGNQYDVTFTLAAPGSTTPIPALTSGFGAIFQNVRLADTSIEFFDGDQSLGKVFASSGNVGDFSFVGALFSGPVVTRVRITLGTGAIFFFDGTTFRAGGADNPAGGDNLVAADDLVFAEPQPATTNQPVVSPMAGQAFNGPVASFSDADPNANARDYTATIDWGDGARSPGVVSAATGGFNVGGSHTYNALGNFPITVTVHDFGGNTLVVSNTAQVIHGATIAGNVFADANHNGALDAGEPGLASVTIFLDVNSTGILDPGDIATTTDASGHYVFNNVVPNIYQVRQVAPAGFARTAPLTASTKVSVATGQDAAGPTFGDVLVSTVPLDFSYLLTLAQHFNQPGTFATGDLNADDVVNFTDLLILAQNFGHPLPAATARHRR